MKNKYLISTIKYAIPILLIYTIVFLTYFPGILVSDALVQWDQTQTLNFDNWHPIYNTIYIYLLSLIINTPAFVVIIQCLIISLIMGYMFSRLEKYYNVSPKILIICSIIFAIIPLNFNFAVTLLKDVLYSSFVLLLTSFIIDIINNNDWLKLKKNMVYFTICLLIISLFRHNGILVVILTMLGLILVYKKQLRLYVVFGLWVALYFILNILAFNVLNVKEASYANKYGPISHIYARLLNSPNVAFTDEELDNLSQFVDVEKLKNTYQQYNMDYSINSQKIEELEKNGSKYLKMGINKFIKYPVDVIKHYIKMTSFLYSPIPFKNSYVVGMFTETDLWIYKDKYPELSENSKISQFLPILKNIENKWQTGLLGDLTMRPALYLYFSVTICILMAIRYKKSKIMLIILPLLFNMLSLAPAIPVFMTRYVYATMLIVWIFIPITLNMIFNKDDRLKLDKIKEE